MSRSTHTLAPDFLDYLVNLSAPREDDILRRLRAETATMADAQMQISLEQGQLMGVLARLLGVRRALEIGVFTGYSALCVARSLPTDGQLVACDVSQEWTDVGRRYWREAGVAERIDLRLGPAAESLAQMLAEGDAASFDFVFIDADKSAYPEYYELSLELLRAGGLMTMDNMFLGGRVLNPSVDDPASQIVHDLNARIFADQRVDPCLVPIGDGLLLARKL